MVNPVNPFDEKIRQRIADSTTVAESLGWKLERLLRPGWGQFIRSEVMSPGHPPTVADVLEAITSTFGRLVTEAVENATIDQPDAEQAQKAAVDFVSNHFTVTIQASLSHVGDAEVIDTVHRLNG